MGYESPGVFKCRVWWLCVCAMINTSAVINYPPLPVSASLSVSLLLYLPISTHTCLSSPDESFEAWISTRPKCIRRADRCLSFGRTRLGAWIRFGAMNIIQGIQGIHPIRGIMRRSHPTRVHRGYIIIYDGCGRKWILFTPLLRLFLNRIIILSPLNLWPWRVHGYSFVTLVWSVLEDLAFLLIVALYLCVLEFVIGHLNWWSSRWKWNFTWIKCQQS